MPITELAGNLLSSNCDIIAHGCNCFNNMGGGIAYQIQALFPEAQKVDFFTTKIGDRNKMGTFTKATQGDKTIYNLYTQYKYGHDKVYVEYDKLKESMIALKNDLIKQNLYESSKIGFPRIGCGLARGDWGIVKEIIEKVFDDKEVFVYVL